MGERLVYEHTGLNFSEIEELPYDVYLFLRRDAFIYACSQTEDGRDYLEKCWLYDQTEPDRDLLRKYSKQGGR